MSDIDQAEPGTRALVLSGPGTGKTETVVRRLEWLVCGRPKLAPGKVLVLSFSRSAVRVLVNRLRARHEADPNAVEELRYLTIRTFDSWAFRMLRAVGYEAEDMLKGSHDSNITLLIDLLKNRPQSLLESEQTCLAQVRHIIVDECQDLTGLRAELVRILLRVLCPASDAVRGFTLLGDPNQSIYDWTMGNGPQAGITSTELVSWILKEYANDLVMPVMAVNYRTKCELLSLLNSARSILHDEQSPAARLTAMQVLIDSAVTKLTDQEMATELRDGGTTGLLCRTNEMLYYSQSELMSDYPRNQDLMCRQVASRLRYLPG